MAAFSRVWGDKGIGNIVKMSFGTVLWRQMCKLPCFEGKRWLSRTKKACGVGGHPTRSGMNVAVYSTAPSYWVHDLHYPNVPSTKTPPCRDVRGQKCGDGLQFSSAQARCRLLLLGLWTIKTWDPISNSRPSEETSENSCWRWGLKSWNLYPRSMNQVKPKFWNILVFTSHLFCPLFLLIKSATSPQNM